MYTKGGKKGPNPWAGKAKNAPFDQPFHLILNVAVGGNFFGGLCGALPNLSAGNQGSWLPTWQANSALQIKSIKMI